MLARQIELADARPAFHHGFAALQGSCRGIPVLHDITARQIFPLHIALVVDDRDRHVLLAELAVDDGELVVLDPIARSETTALEDQQAAERMVLLVVAEAQYRPGPRCAIPGSARRPVHRNRFELIAQPSLRL